MLMSLAPNSRAGGKALCALSEAINEFGIFTLTADNLGFNIPLVVRHRRTGLIAVPMGLMTHAAVSRKSVSSVPTGSDRICLPMRPTV